LSTDEWQSAQVMPTLVSRPIVLTLPRTPTTAFSVVASTQAMRYESSDGS
jgi:hypothetical protein